MKTLITIFRLETEQLLSKRIITLFLVILFLSLYFVNTGIENYKTIIENEDQFLRYEQSKLKTYPSYGFYGTYGVRMIFIPSPLSIFFNNSTPISNLTSYVDSGERLKIYNSFKGKTLFDEKAGGFNDFAGIMLLLGSLLVLYLGYDSLVHKDYLRFMTGFFCRRKLFIGIIFSRIFLVVCFIFMNICGALVLMKINGIPMTENTYAYLPIYFALLVLLSIFFFALGTVAGALKSRFAGFAFIILAWFVSVFFIPGAVSSVAHRKASTIKSDYQLEMEKQKIIVSVENELQASVGPKSQQHKRKKVVKDRIEAYLKNEFKQVEQKEEQLQMEMEANIHFFQTISMLFPTSFYVSVDNEISSKGYGNFVAFYEHIRKLKSLFVNYVFEKKYFSNSTNTKNNKKKTGVEGCFKHRENVYYSESRLPYGFIYGLLATFIYISVLLAVSYRLFNKSLRL